MLTILIYVLIIAFIIYIAQLLWSPLGFLLKVVAGIFALYPIAHFISSVSEWITKNVSLKRSDKEKKNNTLRYLIEERKEAGEKRPEAIFETEEEIARNAETILRNEETKKEDTYLEPLVLDEPTRNEEQEEVSEKDNDNLEMETKKKEDNDIEPKNEVKPYEFPSILFLKQGRLYKYENDSEEMKQIAQRLEQILADFGIKVWVVNMFRSPLVSRFEFQLEQGTSIRKIINLEEDIKLNLAAKDVRIEAPIPGKYAVGIEIQNRKQEVVNIRDIIESKEFNVFLSNLTCAVGIDFCGNKVIADIGKMQNLLIGGTTGSGKTTFLNSLIIGILYKAHPSDVKMIMIDTKYVNLSIYNGIPHLLLPVVTDANKALAALHWALAESKERYRKFADFGVKDLARYNRIAAENSEYDIEKLPQILVIIDDLSDLMAINKKEAEESIARLAGMARATGIYLIIATQRPSVSVVTGLIKANITSRISFKVFSEIDSRAILDEKGAENLIGNGDMLFKPQGYPRPARIQGAYVSDEEILCVVNFLKNQTEINLYSVNEKRQKEDVKKEKRDFARDEYFEEAGRFIIEKDKASIGMLQRLFKIGFNRAAKIMDELCEEGVVGEEEGTKPRRILMTMNEFEEYIMNNPAAE